MKKNCHEKYIYHVNAKYVIFRYKMIIYNDGMQRFSYIFGLL